MTPRKRKETRRYPRPTRKTRLKILLRVHGKPRAKVTLPKVRQEDSE